MSSDQQDEVMVKHTTDPTLVQRLMDERDGFPAHLAKSEGQGDQGLLGIGFPGIENEE